jgi:hypothetical protein
MWAAGRRRVGVARTQKMDGYTREQKRGEREKERKKNL